MPFPLDNKKAHRKQTNKSQSTIAAAGDGRMDISYIRCMFAISNPQNTKKNTKTINLFYIYLTINVIDFLCLSVHCLREIYSKCLHVLCVYIYTNSFWQYIVYFVIYRCPIDVVIRRKLFVCIRCQNILYVQIKTSICSRWKTRLIFCSQVFPIFFRIIVCQMLILIDIFVYSLKIYRKRVSIIAI